MEYIFGQAKRKGKTIDVLKTVGTTHTNLSDSHIIERKYPDSIITDGFFVVDHYLSKDGADGKCYDWYELSNHYRYIDYFTPQKQAINGRIDDTENAICESSEMTETSISDLENAVCELSELVEGGV